MGRPGGAGGGRSGGGHSSSRSGGGHRVSGGRPGGGRPTGGYNFGGSSGRRPPGGGSSYRNPPPPMGPGYPGWSRPPRRNNGGFWKGVLVGRLFSDQKNSSGRTYGGDTYSGNQQGHSSGSTNSGNAKAENVNTGPGYTASGVQNGNVNAGGGNVSASLAEPKIPKWQIAVVLILAVCAVLFGVFGSKESSSREKLTGVSAYDADCIVDEEYWFDSPSGTGNELKEFYDETGIQPEIVIKSAGADTIGLTDSEKESYAQEYFDQEGFEENTFLYMYFCEEDPDTVGFMCYVNGKQVDSIMDSEAIEVFWNNLDKYWYQDMSTDDVFARTFQETAEQIMKKQRTGADIAVMLLIVTAVLAVIFGVLHYMRLKSYNERKRAAETERILNADIHEMADDLADKYNKY